MTQSMRGVDSRHPRHPGQSLTHATHEPMHSRYQLHPRIHATHAI